jgi:molybdate transport system substrate-binding protein
MANMPHAPVVPLNPTACDYRLRNRGTAMKTTSGICAIILLVVAGAANLADAAEIRVYLSGAPSEAAKAIGADFAKDTGHHLAFTVGQPATIKDDLAAGDKADLIILPSPVVSKLNGSGALRAGSAVDVARVGVGVAVREGASKPDISSAAAIRKLLLDAPSIVYPDPKTGGGSAGLAIARMIDQMGITETVKPKLTLVHAIGGGVDLVAKGQAQVGFFIVSEITPVKGAALVGPLPAELQNYIVFGAAIPKSNTAPDPALAFIKCLADPAERQAWLNAGFEPVPAAR